MSKKYIKCFSKEDCDKLISQGFDFMYEQNEVYYLENTKQVTTNFSEDNNLNVKFTNSVNF